jgi:hypothetical protein
MRLASSTRRRVERAVRLAQDRPRWSKGLNSQGVRTTQEATCPSSTGGFFVAKRGESWYTMSELDR